MWQAVPNCLKLETTLKDFKVNEEPFARFTKLNANSSK